MSNTVQMPFKPVSNRIWNRNKPHSRCYNRIPQMTGYTSNAF